MRIKLIAFTQPDWLSIVQFSEACIGINPLRGFLDCYINQSEPIAYPACLDHNNDPMASIRNLGDEYHHCFASFAVQSDIPLVGVRGLEVTEIHGCYVISGSILSFHDLIVKYLTKADGCITHRLLCHVLLHLERFGFREMFARYDKEHIDEHLYKIKEV